MKRTVLLGVASVVSVAVVATAFTGPQDPERVPVTSTFVQAESTSGGHGGGGGGGGSGCSGCFCCFPRTPDGNVAVNGFAPVSKGEATIFTVPHDKWFIATDIEVVVLDANGKPVNDYSVGIFEFDRMGMHGGMKMMKRWANCSPYHSARGIPFMPMCDVTLDRISTTTAHPTNQGKPVQIYYQVNGYLWDDAGSHTGH